MTGGEWDSREKSHVQIDRSRTPGLSARFAR
jgi:hypothetical protein